MNPLVRLIPPPLVRLFARPYVAGDSLDLALDVAAGLWKERGLLSTLDLLAEDIDSEAVATRNFETYLRMIDAVATDPRFREPVNRPTLSLKLSSYTAKPLHEGGDGAGAREAVLRIAEHARERGVRLTVDMESRFWTDHTLETLRVLTAGGHTHVGGVLQSRLHRTAQDLTDLPLGLRVRLVIGIYNEPKEVALTDKSAMKARLLEYAEQLLRAGHLVELATHDEAVIDRFVDEIVPRLGVGPERYEIQMLYGVPRQPLQARLVARGIRCRLYVPFAVGWDMAIAYLRRRLDEYPAMMLLVARNLFHGR